MTTKIFKSINLIRRESGASLNLFRYTAMVCVLLLGVSDVWGSTSNYYSKVTLSKNTAAAGKVYAQKDGTNGTWTENTKTSAADAQYSEPTHTWYIKAEPANGYVFKNWTSMSGWKSGNGNSPSATANPANGKITGKTSAADANGTATANFEEITINAGSATTPVVFENNSVSCTDNTGTITFPTNGDAKTDFAAPTFVNTGHGTFSVTSWDVDASTGSVTVNYKFVGDNTYGGASGTRSRSTTGVVTLKTCVGNNTNSCTIIASFPNIVVSAGSAEDVVSTVNVPKSASATFPVQWADDKDDFTAGFSEISGGGAWTVDSIIYTATDAQSGTITVNYTFTASTVNNHSAKLTLSAKANAVGASNYVVINAESEALASDDASVTYQGDTTKYGKLADAIAAANSKQGAIVKLLRNIPMDDAHKITSPISVTGAMTLDLNSYTIEKTGLVDGNARVFDINMSNANSVFAIMDSRTGGKIRGVGDNNSNLLTTVYVTKGILSFASGEIECVNTNTGANAKATGIRTLADAKLLMTGGTVTATSSGSLARGVYTKTAPGTENYVVISGGTINVKGATQATGIDCESSSTTVDDPKKASVVLSGVTVNVETTGTTDAIAIRTAAGVSLGVQSGTYNATAKTTTAYALQSSGYTAVLGGTFNATATTTTAHALRCEKGITAVRGGTFTATAEQKTAHGAYICDGAKLLTYGGTFKGVVNAMVDGGWVTGTQVYDGGTLEAQGGTFIGEANNLNQSSEIAVCAAGIYLNNSSKASYATISNATLQGKINNVNLNGAANDTHRGAHGLMTRTTSSVTLTNCTISANSAHKYAFGVRSTNTPIDIKNSSISVTSSKSYNYGIYTYGTAAVTMSNSTVECTSQEAECSGAFLTNGTRLDAEKTNFNVTVNQSSATAVTAANSRGVNLEIGSVANLNGCVIKFKGNANYTSTVYGIRNIGTASIEDCTIKVYSVKEAAYALCGGESSQGTAVNSGKFYVSSGTTDGATVTTGTNTVSMYSNNSVGKTYLYGGYYTQNTNLEKFLYPGYGVEALPSETDAYKEGYRYVIRPQGEIVPPVCKIGTTPYTTLEEALEYASKNATSNNKLTILMVANYTLPAGNYTLPQYTTLLVPMAGENNFKDHPDRVYNSYSYPTCNLKLTFAEDAHMDVYGTVQTGGKQSAVGQISQTVTTANNGTPTESYGWIYMSAGSSITLESGSQLYSWGYVTGAYDAEGKYLCEIDAKRGSTVHESFMIKDWRGGSATLYNFNGSTNKNNYKVFPLNQYYIQNIEVPIKFRPGSAEYCDGTVSAGSASRPFNDVKLIGVTNTGSFFEMANDDMSEDTWVRKWYNAKIDQQVYEVNSSASLNNITLSLYGTSFSSSSFVLPITNNMKIHLLTGSMNITQNTELLPGSEIEIDKEATAYIASGKSLYVFDIDEWNAFYTNEHTFPLPYSPSWAGSGKTCPRSRKVTEDAKVNVHGKFVVNGYIYTTAGGANIYSSDEDAGTIMFGVEAPTAQASVWVNNGTGGSNGQGYTERKVNSAYLKNGDDTYEHTAGTISGKSWIYYGGKWNCWEEKNCFGYDNEDKPYAKPRAWVQLTSNEADPTTHLYADAETGDRRFLVEDGCTWWEVEPTPYDGNKYKCVDKDYDGRYKYYEYVNSKWQEAKVTITWKNGSTTLATYDKALYGVRPTYLEANPTKTATSTDYYTWLGWTKDSETGEFFAKDAELPEATANTTYYAYFQTNKFQYTITLKNYDEAVLQNSRWNAGETPMYSMATPEKPATASKEYSFDGWATSKTGTKAYEIDGLPTASAAATYFAHYAEADRKYNITWVNYDGTVLKEEKVTYNTTPSAPTTPTRPNDNYYTYKFDAWSPAISAVSGNQTYTATYNYEKMVTKYEVLFKNGTTTIYSQNLVENTVPVFDGNEPTKDPTAQYSYTFDGWSTTNGGSLVYAKNAALPALTADVIYYAHFAQTTNTYKVLWKSENGKQLLETDAAVAYNADPSFDSETPTKERVGKIGYSHDGWSATVGGAKLTSLPKVEEDKVFYAHFLEGTYYDITFNANGHGSAPAGNEIIGGSKLTAPDDPSEEGYTFVGWYKEEECTNAWDFDSDVVEGNTTLYAKWTINKYKITWRDAQETLENHVIAVEEYEYGEIPSYTYNKPSDYAYSYEMLGWSPEIDTVTENKTYTARYKAIPLTLVVTGERTIEGNVALNSTTVRVSGALRVAPSASLTTTDLILEAQANTSGEITGNVQLNPGGHAYFDLYINDTEPRHWHAFSVPFQIDLRKSGHPVQINGETLTLGRGYDIVFYDGAVRAAQGKVTDCWKYVEDPSSIGGGDSILYPGKAYMIASASRTIEVVRFTKADEASLAFSGTINVTGGDGDNGGWNGIGNPTTYHAIMEAGPTVAQVHDGGKIGADGYIEYDIDDLKYVVGKAVYVQARSDKSVVISPASTQDVIKPAAPARRNARADINKEYLSLSDYYKVSIAQENNANTCNVYVLDEEDKEDAYVIGHDLSKFGLNTALLQMWVNRYDNQLSLNTTAPIDGVAYYPLGINAPQSCEYTISLQSSIDDEHALYLTCDGEAIWNLSEGAFLLYLDKGTTSRFGLRLVEKAPQVATGMDEAVLDAQGETQKILINDHVYIIRGNNVYTIDGQLVK